MEGGIGARSVWDGSRHENQNQEYFPVEKWEKLITGNTAGGVITAPASEKHPKGEKKYLPTT